MEAQIAGDTNTLISHVTVCWVSEAEAKAALVVSLCRMPPNTRDGHSPGAASTSLLPTPGTWDVVTHIPEAPQSLGVMDDYY